MLPMWAQFHEVYPAYIDTAAIATDKDVRLSILNRHPTLDWELTVELRGFKVDKITVHAMISDDLLAVVCFLVKRHSQ